MGIKQVIEEAIGWMAANGASVLIAIVAIGVGALIYWALPLRAERKFKASDAGVMFRVKQVERDQKKLKDLRRKASGSWPYLFTNSEKKVVAQEEYKILSDAIDRENAEIDAFLGVARDGEAV